MTRKSPNVQVELDRKTAKPAHAQMLRSGMDVPFALEKTASGVKLILLGADPFDETAVGRIGADGNLYWALDKVEGDEDERVLSGLQIETDKVSAPIMAQVSAWFAQQVAVK